MHTVLITGASTGIGLEFVRQYAQDNYNVFAAYFPMAQTEELQKVAQKFGHVHLIALDVTKENQIIETALQLKNQSIDILINNAGICGNEEDLASITTDKMMQAFLVNAIAPMQVTRHFISHIAQSDFKTVVSISSIMGSIASNLAYPQEIATSYGYRASKTALNMIMSNIAIDVYDQGMKVLLLHPGHVNTQVGAMFSGDMIDAATSVSGLRKVISEIPRSKEKLFYTYQGELLSW